jgi:hypothetical protein
LSVIDIVVLPFKTLTHLIPFKKSESVTVTYSGDTTYGSGEVSVSVSNGGGGDED